MKSADDINHDEMIPLDFHLSQNYPNPFKEKTKIKYCIAYKTKVKISIINTGGKIIKTLVNTNQEAGTYEIEFDGSSLPDGKYRVKLTAGDYSNYKTMNLSNN